MVPLLNARAAIEQQIADLDRKVMRLARNNAQARRFMTAPGVGPITALCFLATIDDPTTRKYTSGEVDWTGRYSKCGDKMSGGATSTRQPTLGHQGCEANRAA